MATSTWKGNRPGLLEYTRNASKKVASMGVCGGQWKDQSEAQWVAGDMQLGDVLLFHSHTVHKALPDQTDDRMRLSLDNRYQEVGKPADMKNLHLHYTFERGHGRGRSRSPALLQRTSHAVALAVRPEMDGDRNVFASDSIRN